jgi:predicted nucleotidyltransferase
MLSRLDIVILITSYFKRFPSYDTRRVKEILRIPDRFGVPLMVATGYEYGAPPVVHADLSEDSLDNIRQQE